MEHGDAHGRGRGRGRGRQPHQIHFFIDGEQETTSEEELTVAELLALVDKTPDEYYIVERRGRDQVEFRDGATVPIKPGAKFLTVSTGSTPVS